MSKPCRVFERSALGTARDKSRGLVFLSLSKTALAYSNFLHHVFNGPLGHCVVTVILFIQCFAIRSVSSNSVQRRRGCSNGCEGARGSARHRYIATNRQLLHSGNVNCIFRFSHIHQASCIISFRVLVLAYCALKQQDGSRSRRRSPSCAALLDIQSVSVAVCETD